MAVCTDDILLDEPLSLDSNGLTSSRENCFDNLQPLSSQERWPPLGAAASETHSCSQTQGVSESKNVPMNALKDEHEKLNASLMALTSHFAQVQFRLKQIVTAPKQSQDNLLRELEDFAFQACPNVVGPDDKAVACVSCTSHQAYEAYENRLSLEQEKQQMLMDQLNKLLLILDAHAAKKKDQANTDVSFEKDANKKVTPDEIRVKLNLSEDELQKLRPEDIKIQISKAITKLNDPAKAKEQIVNELQGQIQEMEDFVRLLTAGKSTVEQNERDTNGNNGIETGKIQRPRPKSSKKPSQRRNKAAPAASGTASQQTSRAPFIFPAPHVGALKLSDQNKKRIQDASIAVIKRALAVLQIFAISQFGCSAKHFEEHMMRKAAEATSSSTGYQSNPIPGNYAKMPLNNLKSSVEAIRGLHIRLAEINGLHPDSGDDDAPPPVSPTGRKHWPRPRGESITSQSSRSRSSSVISLNSDCDPEKQLELSLQEDLVRLVRGNLAVALKELLQHGLCRTVDSKILTTQALIGCMSSKSRYRGNMHAWDLVNEFYRLKHGMRFNMQPQVKLSESFGVDLGGTLQTPKESLLAVIHRIKTSHEPRRRSFDAMFRAFVCAGLNRGRLAQWIRLLARCPELIDRHYERWSYVARTGFDDILTSLEKLSTLTFYLPENLAIRHLVKSFNEFGDP